MEQVVTKYLKSLRIPVSQKYCEKLIRSHPDYPSLLSISDTLTRLGIEHKAARVSKEQLAGMEAPFLARLNANGGGFTLIDNPKDLAEQVELICHEGRSAAGQDSEGEAVILMADPAEEITDPENGEPLAEESFQRTLFITLLSATTGMVLLASVTFFSWIYLSLLVTAMVGAVVGYLLVARDVGVTYDPVKNFCRAGKKTNCDAILRSDGTRLFGNISFSDAVAGYFLFQMMVLVVILPFTQAAEMFLVPLALLSGLTIPVVIYSLYYQAVKAKTWCRLCLIVSAVLVVQAGLFGWLVAAGLFGLADGILWAAGLVAGLFLTIVSIVFLIKTRLKESSEAEHAEAAASRVKYDPSVFTYLLLQQPQADCTPFEKELLIGNSQAPVKITMAASLGCGPCKDGFERAKRLVRMFPEKVNLSIRFSIPQHPNGNEIDPGQYLLRYWLCRIYGTKHPSEDTEKVMQDWFELEDLSQFREKYPLPSIGETPAIEALAARHSDWFDKADVKGTPTFFVNGYQLPGQYRIEDLSHLVVGLSEEIPVAREKTREAKTEQNH